MVIGSKLDLIDRPESRGVSQNEALEMVRSQNLMYIETSAKEDINVNAIFQMLTCHLLGL